MTREEAISVLEARLMSDDVIYVHEFSYAEALGMAIEVLKAQDIATIQPKRIELADETKAWLDEMDAVEALGNIANICIDWDGYRTADGLGGLINEIWAYARYCADRLLKAQEPVVRCRDCVYFCPNVHDRGDDSFCVWFTHKTRADDYCSKAERRCGEDFCEIGGES